MRKPKAIKQMQKIAVFPVSTHMVMALWRSASHVSYDGNRNVYPQKHQQTCCHPDTKPTKAFLQTNAKHIQTSVVESKNLN